MMYPFLTLDDGTEIVHSETKPDRRVKVYIEKPDAKDCFHHATCWLPGYEWEDIFGFTSIEVTRLKGVVQSVAHLILEFAETGGPLRSTALLLLAIGGGALPMDSPRPGPASFL